jgi:hypothetical protein
MRPVIENLVIEVVAVQVGAVWGVTVSGCLRTGHDSEIWQ